MKPILLLDVDGVLNIIGPGCKKREVRLVKEPALYPMPFVLPFMKWAWRSFDVVWCTAWREGANEIADWAGLPRRPAVVETAGYFRNLKRRFKDPAQWQEKQRDWKVSGAKKIVGRKRRRVLWIEDGISLEAHEWVRTRPDTHYVATDSFEGVTPSHARILAKLADLEGLPVDATQGVTPTA